MVDIEPNSRKQKAQMRQPISWPSVKQAKRLGVVNFGGFIDPTKTLFWLTTRRDVVFG